MSDEICCARCGVEWPIDGLDAKPTPTLWLWIIRLFLGQKRMLSYTADHGYDFDRLECVECYGPGFEEPQP